jgi:hypothetical protein
VLSCDLVDFQIMQARYVADGAYPLLLLFLRQTLAPAGVLLLGKFLERLAALCGGPRLDACARQPAKRKSAMRGPTKKLQLAIWISSTSSIMTQFQC